MEHPGRGGGVDVIAGFEGGDEPWVLGQVGDAAQLDLVVIGDEEREPVRRHECPPEGLAFLRTHRDVVEVRGIRGQATGSRHGLVEGGVDPPVGSDLGQQPLPVGGAQLLDLAVAKEVVDDRVLALELLEGRRVGGVTGLGLLGGGQPELVEQDGPQLGGRVDVEALAGVLLDAGGQILHLGGEPIVEVLEFGPVDAHPEVLHTGQHRHQRGLDLIVQGPQALS